MPIPPSAFSSDGVVSSQRQLSDSSPAYFSAAGGSRMDGAAWLIGSRSGGVAKWSGSRMDGAGWSSGFRSDGADWSSQPPTMPLERTLTDPRCLSWLETPAGNGDYINGRSGGPLGDRPCVYHEGRAGLGGAGGGSTMGASLTRSASSTGIPDYSIQWARSGGDGGFGGSGSGGGCSGGNGGGIIGGACHVNSSGVGYGGFGGGNSGDAAWGGATVACVNRSGGDALGSAHQA
ncbi:hypothetical protein CLOP_g3151 [Closterium sp. NIES-67]|nr:hypothetical protein CLOP_g3151 [Closterium sp. NIES-67]